MVTFALKDSQWRLPFQLLGQAAQSESRLYVAELHFQFQFICTKDNIYHKVVLPRPARDGIVDERARFMMDVR